MQFERRGARRGFSLPRSVSDVLWVSVVHPPRPNYVAVHAPLKNTTLSESDISAASLFYVLFRFFSTKHKEVDYENKKLIPQLNTQF